MSEESGLDDAGLDELASSQDLVCFHSRPDLLMVDLDTPESYTVFAEQYERLTERYSCEFLITKSKSGNRHAYIKVIGVDGDVDGERGVDMGVIGRCAFQAALGSDPKRELLGIKRELLGIMRFFKGGAGPVLFETADEAPKVKEFLR